MSGTNPNTICNLFQAGHTPGVQPTFIAFGKGTRAFETDYDNIAPSVGAAWTLKGSTGALGAIFGRNEGDSVLRAGFTRAYSREGMNAFSGQFGGNPGITINATRDAGRGNLGALPLLFREASRLGAPDFQRVPEYPLTEVVTGDVKPDGPEPAGAVCRFLDDRPAAYGRPRHGA